MRKSENWLIRLLPARHRAQLRDNGKLVPLTFGEVLCDAGDRSEYVYFPVDGFIALISAVRHGAGLEMGSIGMEGMLGVNLTLGVSSSPFQAQVRAPGAAWRLTAAAFRRELLKCEPLRRALGRYLFVTLAQTASSAACLHAHRLGPRLAGWLLLTHDRAGAPSFRVTHELLASALGVRRAGVTLAAGALQQQGLIRYARGALTVLDRRGLERAACTCYAADRATYRRVMH